MTDFGVDPVSDESAGFRRQSERAAKLIAGDGDGGYSCDSQDQGYDAERGPWKAGEFDKQISDADCGDYGGDEGGAVHGWSLP
jgi:hypothetical protein